MDTQAAYNGSRSEQLQRNPAIVSGFHLMPPFLVWLASN
jgi:hypothetical protein